jgi:hypothetical protein
MTTVNPIPIQVRRGTAAEATAGNVVLLPGEIGFEEDTGKVKIGVAAGTAWNDLPYLTDAVAAALATEIAAREAAVEALSASVAGASALPAAGTGLVDTVTAADATVTVGGTSANPTVKVTAGQFDAAGAATAARVAAEAASTLPGASGPGQLPPSVVSVPSGTPANRVPVTTAGDTVTFEALATVTDEIPTPDTAEGSAGTASTLARGDHTHPASSLYDAHGRDDLNTFGPSTEVAVPDPAVNQSSFVILAANSCPITLPEPVAGKRLRLAMQQDGVGSRQPSFPSNVGWPNGTNPEWSTSPGAVDVIELACFDGVNWLGTFQLGLAVPPAPTVIVQSASGTLNTGDVYGLALPAGITPGNAVLVLISAHNQINQPSGGGCSSFTQIAAVGSGPNGSYGDDPDTGQPVVLPINGTGYQLWIGVGSTGGEGSQIVSLAAGGSGSIGVFEIQGVTSGQDGAVVYSPSQTGTNTRDSVEGQTNAAVSPRSGDFVGILVSLGNNSGGPLAGVSDADLYGDPGVFDGDDGWIVNVIESGFAFVYQLSTVNAQNYTADVAAWPGVPGYAGWQTATFFLH